MVAVAGTWGAVALLGTHIRGMVAVAGTRGAVALLGTHVRGMVAVAGTWVVRHTRRTMRSYPSCGGSAPASHSASGRQAGIQTG